MIVLFWSRATRDLLKSFGWGIAALHRLHSARKLPSPRRPPHRISRSHLEPNSRGGAPGNGRRLDLTLRALVIMPASGLTTGQNFRRSGTGSSNPFPSEESGAN